MAWRIPGRDPTLPAESYRGPVAIDVARGMEGRMDRKTHESSSIDRRLSCGAFGTGLGLLAAFTILWTSGCMALTLSSRGAPDEAIREFTTTLEAVDVPAHHAGHEGAVWPEPVWISFPESGWIHGWDYTLRDAEGDTVPRAVLHHFKVMDPGKRELFSEVMLHVVGAGSETTPVSLPRQLGYRIEAGDSLLFTAMLHNPTERPLRGVQLEATLRYSVPGEWNPPLEVMPFFAHVTPPMHVAAYDLPPGRSHRSVDITPAVDVDVLGLGAHLHRYAEWLLVQDLTDGEVVWEARPELAPDGTVLRIPQDYYVWSRSPTLRKDHTYRVTAVYDNPRSDTIHGGGMATLGGVVRPGEEWPGVDTSAEEYRWYMSLELEPETAQSEAR